MATRVERAGIEACISKVNQAIEDLNAAAKQVNDSMNELLTTGKALLMIRRVQSMKISIRAFSPILFRRLLRTSETTSTSAKTRSLSWISSLLATNIWIATTGYQHT